MSEPILVRSYRHIVGLPSNKSARRPHAIDASNEQQGNPVTSLRPTAYAAQRVAMVTPEEAGARLQCPICLEGIWPCVSVKFSFCHPIHHVLHWNCWWDLPDEQRERCCVCRQQEVSRPTAFMIYNRFPSRGLDLSFEELCGEPSMRWFSPAGQGLIRDFVQGELTEEELIRIAHAVRRRTNVDDAISNFIAASCKRQKH